MNSPDPGTRKFIKLAAHTLEYAKSQLKLQNCDAQDLVGKIIDIRQNEEWYRCRVTNVDGNDLTIDETDLDSWPFDYFTIPLDNFRDPAIRIDGKLAIILRSNSCISFTNLARNQGKTIVLNNIPITLMKSLGNGSYTTDAENIDLKGIIEQGGLNSCLINGDVAKRHVSALRREPNASQQGIPWFYYYCYY